MDDSKRKKGSLVDLENKVNSQSMVKMNVCEVNIRGRKTEEKE